VLKVLKEHSDLQETKEQLALKVLQAQQVR